MNQENKDFCELTYKVLNSQEGYMWMQILTRKYAYTSSVYPTSPGEIEMHNKMGATGYAYFREGQKDVINAINAILSQEQDSAIKKAQLRSTLLTEIENENKKENE